MHKPEWSITACLALVLTSCSYVPAAPDDPRYAPVPPTRYERPQITNGAIYQSSVATPLFEDIKARRVGDTLTVVLVEKTSASKSASTKTKKDTSSTIANPTILGSTPLFNVPSALPLASTKNNTLAASLSSQNEFDGEGNSDQSNKLVGTITVSVADVLPNGNLSIRGEKWIGLNQGEEYIRLAGVVRPTDIDTNNQITSDKIANARITYGGRGAISDSNAVGWLQRFFTSPLWPI